MVGGRVIAVVIGDGVVVLGGREVVLGGKEVVGGGWEERMVVVVVVIVTVDVVDVVEVVVEPTDRKCFKSSLGSDRDCNLSCKQPRRTRWYRSCPAWCGCSPAATSHCPSSQHCPWRSER